MFVRLISRAQLNPHNALFRIMILRITSNLLDAEQLLFVGLSIVPHCLNATETPSGKAHCLTPT